MLYWAYSFASFRMDWTLRQKHFFANTGGLCNNCVYLMNVELIHARKNSYNLIDFIVV